MKTKTHNCAKVFMVATLLSALTVYADTIPEGNVSGTWYAANSPYYIAGNITIPSGDTLDIEPGVVVNFLGYYYLNVNGLLAAEGTEADTIVFTANTDWMGLLIQNAPDSTRLEYCALEAVNASFGLIYCVNSNPVISRCRISNNTSYTQGGGISLYNSNAQISHCTISGNYGTAGGGIRCHDGSAPHISHCDISGNNAGFNGGGIAVESGSDPVIENCTISRNRAIQGAGIAVVGGSSCTIIDCTIRADSTTGSGSIRIGGGIYMNSPAGSLAITGSTISDCYSYSFGGGIYIQSAASVSIERSILDANRCFDLGGAIYSVDCSDLFIDHCDLVNNSNYLPVVGGIMLDGSTNLTLTNCIFRSQDGHNIYFMNYSSAQVSYCDFYDWGSTGGSFGGNTPVGLGTLVQTNANGDSCDIFYNILMDPLFEDFPNGNYHLTAGSPCIDAGDPTYPYDPDSTIADQGCYFFDQRMPSIALSTTALGFGGVTVGQAVDLGFVIHNLGNANLLITSIFNDLGVFTNDWSPLDSIVPPGDSLEVMVTFMPDDTIAFNDTCWIDNNDSLCYVTLTGQGLPPGVAEGALVVPGKFALHQPLPNPCKLFATITFELPRASAASLSVYDVSGRLVSQLIKGLCEAGIHDVTLDASGLSAGVYFYRLKAAGCTAVRKIIVTE